jgi:hypothetical protein
MCTSLRDVSRSQISKAHSNVFAVRISIYVPLRDELEVRAFDYSVNMLKKERVKFLGQRLEP